MPAIQIMTWNIRVMNVNAREQLASNLVSLVLGHDNTPVVDIAVLQEVPQSNRTNIDNAFGIIRNAGYSVVECLEGRLGGGSGYAFIAGPDMRVNPAMPQPTPVPLLGLTTRVPAKMVYYNAMIGRNVVAMTWHADILVDRHRAPELMNSFTHSATYTASATAIDDQNAMIVAGDFNVRSRKVVKDSFCWGPFLLHRAAGVTGNDHVVAGTAGMEMPFGINTPGWIARDPFHMGADAHNPVLAVLRF